MASSRWDSRWDSKRDRRVACPTCGVDDVAKKDLGSRDKVQRQPRTNLHDVRCNNFKVK